MFKKLISLLFTPKDDFESRSYKWTKARKEFLENNPNCAACGRNKKLEVHHIKPYYLNPDLEFDYNNLIVLCDEPCHFVFGHLMNYQSWNETVVEDCKTYYEKIKHRPRPS
ncbi:MAG: HNH endonuclease [Crocinitomicaceae bacterium]|nr:HNH endonuclease [Crocinitomicaceae bacterium]